MENIKHAVIHLSIVGDYGIARAALCALITSFTGFEIDMEASSSDELAKLVATAKPLPDICLLNITPFFSNSYTIVQAIKKNWPEMKCIVISGFDDEYAVMQMLKSGADGYILQREPAELNNALHIVHDKGSYHSEAVNSHIHHAFNNPGHTEKISDREMEFLSLYCQDHNYGEIAKLMNVSRRTVEGYHNSLAGKVKIKSKAGLVKQAIRMGIISL